MKEFLLIFRRDLVTTTAQQSPAEMQDMLKPWQDWMGSLAARQALANPGNRLSNDGRVVKSGNLVTNGPYVEIKEGIGGYIIVRAASIDEATVLAKGCPIMLIGGNVEVRAVVPMDSNG